MKRGIFLGITGLVLILSSSLVLAAISANLPEFVEIYGPGTTLGGILNLSLDSESADLNLEARFDNVYKSILLRDFLKNSGVNYSCIPSDCSETYSQRNPENSKTISPGTEYLALFIGLGTEVNINSLSFDISGQGESESCGIPPVSMDILNDESIDWYYSQPSEQAFCYGIDDGYGDHYDKSLVSYSSDLTDRLYCQRINLERSGMFELGVDMQNGSSAPVTLSIIDSSIGEEASCEANATLGITSCIVNFTAPEKKDYYVCVSSSLDSNHKIKSELVKPTCGYGFSYSEGFRGFQCTETSSDFGIYARPKMISSFNGTVKFDVNSFISPVDLVSYIQEYLDLKYNRDCSNGCVIPIKLELNQDIVLSNLDFKYSAGSGIGDRTEQQFYSASRTPARLNLNRTLLPLSASGITVPSNPGKYNFYLTLGGSTIKNVVLEVGEVPRIVSIAPVEISALVPTIFTAVVTSPKNNSIQRYVWEFGDGTSEETIIPSIEHTYGIGAFTLTLRAIDSEGLTGTGTFNVLTSAPRTVIEDILKKKRENVELLKSDVANLPSWYSKLILDVLNIDLISSNLQILENDFQRTDADYVAIKNSLDYFVVYSGIKDDVIGSSPLAASIDLGALSVVGENIDFDKREQIISELQDWNRRVQMKINYVVKYAASDISFESNLDLMTIATLNINSTHSEEAYLIIQLPQGVSSNDTLVNGNYEIIKSGNILILSLNNLNKEIEMAIPGRINDIKVFASPSISDLILPSVDCGNGICESGEDYESCPQDCRRPIWLPIFLSILIWLALMAGIYWIWKYYAKKYDLELQEKLFKEKSEYMNLVSFIAGELNKGKDGKEIRKELSEAGWKNDQIEYSMNKVLKQTLEFQKQTILDFIIRESGKGRLEGEISGELKKAGWNEDLIKKGFKKFKRMQKRKRF